MSLGGLGQDKEAVSLLANLAPLDKPGYLHAHLFVARTLLAKTDVTLREIHTAEQHLKQVVTLDPVRSRPMSSPGAFMFDSGNGSWPGST